MGKKDRISRIEEALVESHRSRTEINAEHDWNELVMARVRRESRKQPEDEWTVVFQGLVWRFAAVAATLAVVFSTYAFSKGITPGQIAAGIFIDDPSGISISQFIQM